MASHLGNFSPSGNAQKEWKLFALLRMVETWQEKTERNDLVNAFYQH